MAENLSSWIRDPSEFFSGVASELVAESYLSYNPALRRHVGKILLKSMKKHPEDLIIQIDASSGEEESIGSVLDRSVSLAQALAAAGVGVGDVVATGARNHVDSAIPLYASLLIGATFMGVDPSLKFEELKTILNIAKPKIVMCEVDNLDLVLRTRDVLEFETIAFGTTEHCDSLSEFINKHKSHVPSMLFRAADYDPATTTAVLAATTGSSGPVKLAEITHENLASVLANVWISSESTYVDNSRLILSVAQLCWLPAVIVALQSAIFGVPRVQTSAAFSSAHFAEIVKKYRPAWAALTPRAASALLKAEGAAWAGAGAGAAGAGAGLETLGLWGDAVPEGLIQELNKSIGKEVVVNGYGMSECTGLVFSSREDRNLGSPLSHLQVKLCEPGTKTEVLENGTGELYVKGASVFKGYRDSVEATRRVLDAEGWFATGDLFRRQNGDYYFVDRLGDNFKYKDTQISPEELENVIKRLERVAEVVVVSVQSDAGAVPLAAVVAADQHEITEETVVNFVKENVSNEKELRGGVMFIGDIPMTASGKLDRRHLQKQAAEHYNSRSLLNGLQKITHTTVPRRKVFCCC